MKKTVWKSILCALLVTLTACILCIGAFAAKYTCIKSGCSREADKGSAYCWVHPVQIFHQEQHFLQLQIFVQQLLLQQQKILQDV